MQYKPQSTLEHARITWQPLKFWWFATTHKLGKRPSKAAISIWYLKHAPLEWQQSIHMPTLEQVLQMAETFEEPATLLANMKTSSGPPRCKALKQGNKHSKAPPAFRAVSGPSKDTGAKIQTEQALSFSSAETCHVEKILPSRQTQTLPLKPPASFKEYPAASHSSDLAHSHSYSNMMTLLSQGNHKESSPQQGSSEGLVQSLSSGSAMAQAPFGSNMELPIDLCTFKDAEQRTEQLFPCKEESMHIRRDQHKSLEEKWIPKRCDAEADQHSFPRSSNQMWLPLLRNKAPLSQDIPHNHQPQLRQSHSVDISIGQQISSFGTNQVRQLHTDQVVSEENPVGYKRQRFNPASVGQVANGSAIPASEGMSSSAEEVLRCLSTDFSVSKKQRGSLVEQQLSCEAILVGHPGAEKCGVAYQPRLKPSISDLDLRSSLSVPCQDGVVYGWGTVSTYLGTDTSDKIKHLPLRKKGLDISSFSETWQQPPSHCQEKLHHGYLTQGSMDYKAASIYAAAATSTVSDSNHCDVQQQDDLCWDAHLENQASCPHNLVELGHTHLWGSGNCVRPPVATSYGNQHLQHSNLSVPLKVEFMPNSDVALCGFESDDCDLMNLLATIVTDNDADCLMVNQTWQSVERKQVEDAEQQRWGGQIKYAGDDWHPEQQQMLSGSQLYAGQEAIFDDEELDEITRLLDLIDD